MALIKSFTVLGLGGRKEPISFELNSRVNVFWGLNGSGKTSLLKILHAALDDSTQGLGRVAFLAARVVISHQSGDLIERVIHKSNDPQHIEGHRISSRWDESSEDEGEGSLWRWKTEVKPREGEFRNFHASRIKHTFLPISRVSETGNMNSRIGTWSGDSRAVDDNYFDSVFADQVRRRWLSYHSEALNQIQVVQQQGIGQILSLLFNAKAVRRRSEAEAYDEPEQAYYAVRNFLSRQKIPVKMTRRSFFARYNTEPAMRDIVENIQEVMAYVEDALRPQIELQVLIESLYSGSKYIEFSPRGIVVRMRDGDEPMPLETLSSGERQLLQILLEVLAAGRSCVIVDEPELSMHVDWQRKLIDSMRLVNPHCQLILATHSPEIMASASYESIHEL